MNACVQCGKTVSEFEDFCSSECWDDYYESGEEITEDSLRDEIESDLMWEYDS